MQKGSLQDFINSTTPSPWNFNQRNQIILDIVEGMRFVHSCGYLHRSLTSSNILLAHQNNDASSVLRAKISDFGMWSLRVNVNIQDSIAHALSKSCSNIQYKSNFGTVYRRFYLAPELNGAQNSKNFQEGSDVYSFGVVLLEICTLLAPKAALELLDTDDGSEQALLNHKPKIPHLLVKTIFDCCNSTDPKSRPSFSTLYNCLLNSQNSDKPKSKFTWLSVTESGIESRSWLDSFSFKRKGISSLVRGVDGANLPG